MAIYPRTVLSPSLVGILVMSAEDLLPRELSTEGILGYLQEVLPQNSAHIPIIGRSTSRRFEEFFGESTRFVRGDGDDYFFWGTYPALDIVTYARSSPHTTWEERYLDFGGILETSGWGGSQQALQGLASQLAGPAVAKACLAIVDRGLVGPGRVPNTYGGKVSHLSTVDIECDVHADHVLFAALDRLQHQGILKRTHVVMDLVPPPTANIGLRCFEHVNSTEMLTAVQRVAAELRATWANTPWALSLSMGTHCGPHNGQSPLEGAFKSLISGAGPGFAHVAAGNDGRKGFHADRPVKANVDDYLEIDCGHCTGTELLVELWWDSSGGNDLIVEVTVPTMLPITAATIGPGSPNTFSFAGTSVQRAFVYGARCVGSMSCIAFALRTATSDALEDLKIEFTLHCSGDLRVQSWIVIAPGDSTRFQEDIPSSTLRVPSTLATVFCVAGANPRLRPWRDSSQGPAPDYGGGPAAELPTLAHQVDLSWAGNSLTPGTSYAAPRSAADSLAVLLDPTKNAAKTGKMEHLRDEMVNGASATAHPRIGFGVAPL